jgi:hypothetical protein
MADKKSRLMVVSIALHLISSWKEFWFVSAVRKNVNVDTTLKVLLAILCYDFVLRSGKTWTCSLLSLLRLYFQASLHISV